MAVNGVEASLPPEQSERFATHVAGCRGCQAYLRQLRMTVDIVHTAGECEPVDSSALLASFREWSGTADADIDSA